MKVRDEVRKMDEITVCLVGDDRERSYPVAWLGTADVSVPDHYSAETEFALIRVGEDRETAVYKHPEYGWVSLHDAAVRDCIPADGFPAMTDARLGAAD